MCSNGEGVAQKRGGGDRERETDRQTDRKTDRQTDRQTDRDREGREAEKGDRHR